MATRYPTVTQLGPGTLRVRWSGLLATDVGDPFACHQFKGKTVHMYGTFGGSVALQGNNGGTTWITVTDPQGNPISMAAEAIEEVLEAISEIRPSAGAGVGNVTVDLVVRW